MFRALNGRVLVKPEPTEKETASGIIIATKVEEKPVIGTVIVGNDEVKEGDRILFSKFGYDEVTIDRELHYVVSSATILGIF